MKCSALLLACLLSFSQLFALDGVLHTQTRTPSRGVLIGQAGGNAVDGQSLETVSGTADSTGGGACAGTFSWTSASGITTQDDTGGRCTGDNTSTTCNCVRGTNFGFSIPAGATIKGVTLVVRKQKFFGNAADTTGLVMFAGGAIVGNNKEAEDPGWSNTWTDDTFGGPTDLWGATLTPTLVNASNFGFGIAGSKTNSDLYVDVMRATIYYTVSD